MKSIRVDNFGGPEVLRIVDLPEPHPEKRQCLIRLQAAGVNPVETYIRSGKYARLPQLPYTPGTDGAGIVEAVGPDVQRVQKGDRVYIYRSLTGTYSESALCEEHRVFPLPEGFSFPQGAALGVPYGTAYRAIFQRGAARSGEVLLVHGASGGVGVAAVQLAVAAGLTVIGTAGSERGRQLVKEQGAAHVLSHEEANEPARIKALLGGRLPNLIVEMLANANLAKDLAVLAPGGRVIVVGSRGSVEIDPRMTMGGEIDIRGMTLMAATEEDLASTHAAIGTGLRNRTLRPVVGEEIPLADAPRAHIRVMEGESYGKIVLVP